MDRPPRDRLGYGGTGLPVGSPMIEPFFGRCIYCGNPTAADEWRHVRCEFMDLIEKSYQRMIERIKNPQPPGGKRLSGNTRQKIAAIQTIKKGN
jgi:hypothetical protein